MDGGSYPLLTEVVRNEWAFNGWILTDNANTRKFMDAKQMIQAGGDTRLTVMDQSQMWTFDNADDLEYYYARQAMHHLLYTVANSHAMNNSMPGSEYGPQMQKSAMIRIGVNSLAIIGLLLLGGTAIRNARSRRRERAERRLARIEATPGPSASASSSPIEPANTPRFDPAWSARPPHLRAPQAGSTSSMGGGRSQPKGGRWHTGSTTRVARAHAAASIPPK